MMSSDFDSSGSTLKKYWVLPPHFLLTHSEESYNREHLVPINLTEVVHSIENPLREVPLHVAKPPILKD